MKAIYTCVYIYMHMYIYIYVYLLFRATPAAHGGSQLGVQLELQLLAYTSSKLIWAASVSYSTAHDNTGSFNPPSKARDNTYILMNPSWVG